MKKFYYILLLSLLVIIIFTFGFLFKKERVAIIGAMDVEIEDILNDLSEKQYKHQNDYNIITGNVGKYKIVLIKSGVGKVNAASTTQYIIDTYKPKFIINTGVAGSLSSDLKVGDVVIAEKMVQHDFDVTAFGSPKGYMDNGVEPDKPTIYYSDKKLIDNFTEKTNKNLKKGTIATGDIFVTDKNLKNNIKKEFNADVIDMESAAIVQTAKRNNIPVLVLRTISDENDGSEKDYNQNKQNTAQQSALLVLDFLKSYK